MTTINVATDIPSGITTLEQLIVWATSAAAIINPTEQVVEGTGYSERACQSGTFYVVTSGMWRNLARTSIQMSADMQSGSAKPWTYAIELSNTPLPASFKSN